METDGARVRLRPFEAEDAEPVVAALQHSDLAGVGLLDDDVDLPRSRVALREAVESWAKPEQGETWVIDAGDTIVGWARAGWGWDALSPWAGVAVIPEHRRRGIGTESADILLAHLFDDTVAHTVHVWIAEWNEPGLAFAHALGFSVSGRVRRTGVRSGRYFDTVAFELLRQDWEERRGPRR